MASIIDELRAARALPRCAKHFSLPDLMRYVNFCQTKALADKTIMARLSVLKHFFKVCHIPFKMPCYITLGLQYKKRTSTVNSLTPLLLTQIEYKPIYYMMGFQYYFGLTRQEAIRFDLKLHFTPTRLNITHEIAYNNQPRVIPIVTEEQHHFISRIKTSLETGTLSKQYQPMALSMIYQSECLRMGIDANIRHRRHYVDWRLPLLLQHETLKVAHYTLANELGVSCRQLRNYV